MGDRTTIGIVLVCTNSYFILALRFIKKFIYHYNGNSDIVFYLFTDTDPAPYLSEKINYKYYHTKHEDWRSATNSKFQNILLLKEENFDYLFYFDADTNIGAAFDESWFIGDLVGGEHYGNKSWMKEIKDKPFERNSRSSACVPIDSKLNQIYCYGAFFGGAKKNILDFCGTLVENQEKDKKINFEPCWNDESYINHYFHFNPPKIIPSNEFKFFVSDKGGIGETRDVKLSIEKYKNIILDNKNKTFDFHDKKIIFID